MSALTQADLTGLFASRPQGFAWFIGAGASRMSGLPTAVDIIWDLKRRHYSREENQEITRQDMQNDAVQTRIQSFMDSHGFPSLWADDEYTVYFEKIFGTNKERQRRYLSAILAEDRVTLTVGNRILGALLATGMTRAVFTTNFDTVVERAVADVSGRSLAAFHLEGSTAAVQALNNEEFPLYCKLHGDFRYDSIKNLSADLAHQDRQLTLCLQSAASRFGFIVAGYSGRDASVMAVFREALAQVNPFPNGLFWTTIKGSPVPPVVTALIADARSRGVNAAVVEIETFDALLLRLWRNLPDKPAAMEAKVRRSVQAGVKIALPSAGTAKPLLRLNALPIRTLPTRCLVARTSRPYEWAELRDLQRQSDPRLLMTKADEIWCWGPRSAVKAAFGANLVGIDERDVPLDLSSPGNLHVKGFLEDALGTALARGRPLLSRTRRTSTTLIADPHAQDKTLLDPVFHAVGRLSGTVNGLFAPITEEHPEPAKVSWAEAVRVSIVQKQGETWAVLDPDIWIWPPRAREVATDFLDQRRKGRFNNKFNVLLDAWVQALIGSGARRTDVVFQAFDGDDAAANPAFRIHSQTAFSQRLQR
ncbi:SIR2 family protein [Sphingomonas sanguinis]|uniref:Uncharacterized protein n=1 Tax=Sphingomonas sanguinis TaxID=33051 RepID=A0A147IYI6_9SPHN|nr:SIR2 family protein [Sphingomonas sanguinis]KTW00851.1 hypothetical protein SB4_06695 [Sphingomonas sanguinis]